MYIKKLLIVSIIVVAVSFSITALADEVVVNVDNLNIRSGPGTEYESIGQANSGEIYSKIKQETDWVEIKLEDGSGWVNTEYLIVNDDKVVINDTSENNEETLIKRVAIPQEGTHLRSGPSTEFEIIYFAEEDEQFEVISQTDLWYEVRNDKVTGFILKEIVDWNIENPDDFPFNNKTIIIDAGHGGHDVGAIGASGTFEKDFTFLTAQVLEKELTALGASVLLTRQDDEFISLGARTSFSNVMDTDAFISIHYNSFTEQPTVTGIETFYYHGQYEELARNVQEEMIKATNARDRGHDFSDLFVLRQNFKPAVLVELGFISNIESEARLETKAYQKQLVNGMVNGLRRYFSSH